MSTKKLSERLACGEGLTDDTIDAVRDLETRLEQARGYLENEGLTDTVARFMALAVLHGGG